MEGRGMEGSWVEGSGMEGMTKARQGPVEMGVKEEVGHELAGGGGVIRRAEMGTAVP